jgi:hypothetical protein
MQQFIIADLVLRVDSGMSHTHERAHDCLQVLHTDIIGNHLEFPCRFTGCRFDCGLRYTTHAVWVACKPEERVMKRGSAVEERRVWA